jgi:hypothetical protein
LNCLRTGRSRRIGTKVCTRAPANRDRAIPRRPRAGRAATYPEAVLLAEVIGSLRWRRLAAGGPDDQARFTAEVAERLNLRDYRPTVLKDPISHWIEADCWNPPSLPDHTFNSLKTFCGPVGFRKSANNADGKRGTSALWFSRHRRGGDAMLHHRTLNPVVIRDWSTKMEMFTSALALTADTSTASHKSLNLDRPRSPAEFTAYARTHWFRPQQRPSDWLDNATEPVAWAERESGQRPATGGRPALPGEKRLYAKLPAKSNPLRSHLRFDD